MSKTTIKLEEPQKEGKHSFWVAKSLSLKGCVGQGDTPEKAVAELEENEEEWLSKAKQVGIAVPK